MAVFHVPPATKLNIDNKMFYGARFYQNNAFWGLWCLYCRFMCVCVCSLPCTVG